MNDGIEQRLADNLAIVIGQVVAPRRSVVERALLRVGVPERWARLAAATAALRWAWVAGVLVVLLIAGGVGDAGWQSADRLVVLLTLAPLVPVVAVAATYGPSTDRSYPALVVTPNGGLRLLLIRAATVLVAAVIVSLLAAVLAPAGGWMRLGWLLPSVTTTATTLALATRLGTRRAATAVGAAWATIVVAVARLADDAVGAFRLPGQIACAVVAVVMVGAVVSGRRSFGRWLPS